MPWRYENATSLNQTMKCPKLLPKDEHYTRLVVEDCHKRVFHAGVSQTLGWNTGFHMAGQLLESC